MKESLRALNRFGLGARVGEAETIGDPRKWLLDQLYGGPPLLPAGGGVPAEEKVWNHITTFTEARRNRAEDPERLKAERDALGKILRQETLATVNARLDAARPFVERLVAFWSNHLCVSYTARVLVRPLAGLYERQAIRPHVLGRFEDMVLASARHPAMLIYLDNQRSVGPDSNAARRARERRGRKLGLNENYARELMELHTLGVDSGYTQEDVIELARLLTGWRVIGLGKDLRQGERPGFAFRRGAHDPGPKTILGEEYGEGEEEGVRAILALCRHPATARHIATKLVRHFVSDDPPPSAVERVETTFRETGGDLRAVSSALVSLEEAWDPEHRKLRTPQDWFVATLRALRVRNAPERTLGVLRGLRHPLWAPGAPKGYDDTEGVWADPDGLMNRAELARSMARRSADEDLDPRLLTEVVDHPPDDRLPRFLANKKIGRAERLALAVGGPSFQWR